MSAKNNAFNQDIAATAMIQAFGYFRLSNFKPFGPKSDQYQFSPNKISRSLRVKVMRITKLITKGRMLWS